MAQHFLLSSKAKTLSLVQVMKLTDKEAFELFKSLRWGDAEEISCPRCGVVHKPHHIASRKQWRCKHCDYTFSVTSGTIFSNHKLSLKTYLVAIVLFVNAVKGISALQLSRDLGVQYKTAFVLAHKLRESLATYKNKELLNGEVHIDGAYIHTTTRPKNKKEDRVDRRKSENQPKDKRCILVIRQKTEQTRTFIINSEEESTVLKLVKENVHPDATIHADENSAYNILHGYFNVKRVNHSKEYRSDDGTTNNYAESYFSRFRRMQIGQVHKISNKYLSGYSNEIAYREDMRSTSNGIIVKDILTKCLNTKTNKNWCGY
ncbi:IS1595 family transposase [Escherichia coli]|uniref:IS1595 family transposase n=2 Tax=Escherichia coli TaxID=562 RepID=UPI0002CB8911|nr:IS1595 family transposase [Escherichia coli]EMU81224.1 putative transposase [Escherichia coli MP021017.9]EMU83432.1 putative transposase [Escherichia coli MP021017.6]EMU85701.1 putative transposase [Escherichia coli MP021017.5]EMU96259.1 putative transposase [Escherichia coli MP021017.4]EMU97543.1 putative transposase [Escherichia coli MP021017.3]